MMVYAGSVIEEGQCLIRVTQQEGSSRYDKIVEMIEQTEKLKSEAEHKAANLADRLVPYTLLGSAATWLLSGNALRAQSVLMVDFSCALKLAMPLAVLSAMREAALHHITVKGGKYLEAVAQADTIVFDKTGTLTYASPRVMRVVLLVIIQSGKCSGWLLAWKSIFRILWPMPWLKPRVIKTFHTKKCTPRWSIL